jgi:hypothetical protein
MTYTPWTRYTVGIEMEMNRSTTSGTAITGRQIANALSTAALTAPVAGEGNSYHHSSGSVWDVKYDSSAGYEVASPALRFDADGECDELRKGCAALASLRPSINEQCGLHISVFVGRDFTWKNLQRFVSLWAQFESNYFAILPDSRQNNTYCYPLRESSIFTGNSVHWSRTQAALRATDEHTFQMACDNISKYAAVRLDDWWMTGRIEFRLHSGTVDYEKIRNFALLVCATVERAKVHEVLPAARPIWVKVPRPSATNRKGFTNQYLLETLGLRAAWVDEADVHSKGAVIEQYMAERRARFLTPRARRAGRISA